MRASSFVVVVAMLLGRSAWAETTSEPTKVESPKVETAAPPGPQPCQDDSQRYREKGVSFGVGLAYHSLDGIFHGASVPLWLDIHPVKYVGLRVGARFALAVADEHDDLCYTRCGKVGVQFPLMLMLTPQGPVRGFYAGAGVALAGHDTIHTSAYFNTVAAKFGGGYKLPTSRNKAVDMFMMVDIGRYNGEQARYMTLDLGVGFDLGL